jgi:hypothetical protein
MCWRLAILSRCIALFMSLSFCFLAGWQYARGEYGWLVGDLLFAACQLAASEYWRVRVQGEVGDAAT